jgi:glucokinase
MVLEQVKILLSELDETAIHGAVALVDLEPEVINN